MAYKKRPGIEMIQVCGQNMLVAERAVWEDLPRVRPVSKTWAVCWTLMKDEQTSDDAIRSFAVLFHKTEEEVRGRFGEVFRKLFEEGYLIEAPEEGHDAD